MVVFVDVDGTLVGSDGSIRPNVLEAADTLRELGTRLSLATGRPREGVAGELSQRIDASAPHIFLNGALVDTGRGRRVRTIDIDRDVLQSQIEAARRWDETLELYTVETHYVDELTAPCREHADHLDLDPEARDLEEVADTSSVLKCQWIVEESRLPDLRELDRQNCRLEVVRSPLMPDWTFVQVVSDEAGKGVAAEAIAGQLGEDLADAVAVGDGANDRSLLEAVGHPFAMGNAAASLREDFRTVGDIEDDGVLEVLEYAAQLSYRREQPGG
jgi:Cof subfamily protein (haloacid dehalogenase superfamily)